MQIERGTRVQTHKWSPELFTGTVTNVSDDGESVYVRFDGTSFTECEMDRADVEVVPGSGDSTVPYAVVYAADPGQ